MKLGNKLKRLPMGYFSENNIGNITAIATSDMSFIEENSMMQISNIVSINILLADKSLGHTLE